jgi:nucleoside-diphosphate-sugar epimerase
VAPASASSPSSSGEAPEPGFLPDSTELVLRDTDASSVEDLEQLVRGVDVVIHAAGADGRNLFSKPAIDAFRSANVDSVERLVQAMRRAGSRSRLEQNEAALAAARHPAVALSGAST